MQPSKLFLIDGIGGLLTGSILAVIRLKFPEMFGMPVRSMSILFIIGFVCAFYSISCFLFIKKKWKPFLRTIAIVNLLYCCLTTGLVIYFYAGITIPGRLYFLIEVIIIILLAVIELKTVSKNGQ